MLETLFIRILNMSYQGAIVICFILLARFLLKIIKAPKKYAYLLWSVAFIRLICPFNFESIISLLPIETEPIRTAILYDQTPQIQTGSMVIDRAINQVLPAGIPYASINPMQVWMFIAQNIWFLGIIILFLYNIFSYVRLRYDLIGGIRLRDNIYIVDHLQSPFVIGLFRPRIYLPSNLQEREMGYIIQHERAHLRRYDHIIKILAFMIVILHWFNPFAWISFFFFCRDMEMSCDEHVMKTSKEDIRKEYSVSLLSLSIDKKLLTATPLAFGEGEVKARIKNIAHYKKPMVIIAVCALIGIVVLGFSLLSNPITTAPLPKVLDEFSLLEEEIENTVIIMDHEKRVYPSAYNQEFLDFFGKLKVKKVEINKDRSEDRQKNISIIFTISDYDSLTRTVYISKDYSQIWYDNGVKPSFSYRILEPGKVKGFLDRMKGSVTEAVLVPEANDESKQSDIDGSAFSTDTTFAEATTPVTTEFSNSEILLDIVDSNEIILEITSGESNGLKEITDKPFKVWFWSQYRQLELEPASKEEAPIKYQYLIKISDISGNLLQTVILYDDAVKLDDIMYIANESVMELLLRTVKIYNETR